MSDGSALVSTLAGGGEGDGSTSGSPPSVRLPSCRSSSMSDSSPSSHHFAPASWAVRAGTQPRLQRQSTSVRPLQLELPADASSLWQRRGGGQGGGGAGGAGGAGGSGGACSSGAGAGSSGAAGAAPFVGWKPTVLKPLRIEVTRSLHPPPKRLPARLEAGAETFDARLRGTANFAHRVELNVRREPSTPQRNDDFEVAVQELMMTRYVVRERLEGFSAIVGTRKPKAKRPWKIETSIWAGRAKWCDAKGFWDTDKVVCKMLECDWKRAVGVGLSNYIERNDRDEDDGDDVPETQECYEVLWTYRELIYMLFDYYACRSGDDIATIGLNACERVSYALAHTVSSPLHTHHALPTHHTLHTLHALHSSHLNPSFYAPAGTTHTIASRPPNTHPSPRTDILLRPTADKSASTIPRFSTSLPLPLYFPPIASLLPSPCLRLAIYRGLQSLQQALPVLQED